MKKLLLFMPAGAFAARSREQMLTRFFTPDVAIAEARRRGAFPVLVTPMQRRNFDGAKIRNTLGDFPESVRQTATEENVPLIDLTKMSIDFYEAPGPEKLKPAIPPGLEQALPRHRGGINQ
jgi:hypothetical protein